MPEEFKMSEGNTITVEAGGSFKKQIAAGTTLHNVQTVGEAITRLNLPDGGELMIMVNGRLAYWQTELQDGDVLKLLPAIGGGRS